MANLRLKIGCTPEDLKKAQRLRFEVFNQEMNKDERPLSDTLLDQDEFDDICEHIIIVDTKRDIVVGTYRMLLDSAAGKNKGFYSQTKFNLEAIKRLEGPLLEVGRSCVHKDYRDRQVLNLLWQGIVQYAVAHEVKYIFGCANILTADPYQVSEYFCMLKAMGLFLDMGISPLKAKHAIAIDENLTIDNPKAVFNKLPTLFKGYMNVGLKVCSYPVMGDFKTAVFFVLLDIQNMNKVYKRRFFGDYLENGLLTKRSA